MEWIWVEKLLTISHPTNSTFKQVVKLKSSMISVLNVTQRGNGLVSLFVLLLLAVVAGGEVAVVAFAVVFEGGE